MQKKEHIRKMFAGISKRYDFLNHLLSLGRDEYWRRFAAALLPSGYILDICSGTGDVAIEVSKKSNVIASDFCEEMLQLCTTKMKKRNIENIYCIQNDAENLSFNDETFNGAIAAFGIRNVADIKKALSEMHRVVKKGGKVVILEFSQPENKVFKWIYYLYFQEILPFIGAAISKKKGAYSYLPSSVMAFPERNEFVELMKEAGLVDVEFYDLTFGIVTVYAGVKS
ncbi:MAG: bifunctional demethylmenaquinone methyltransferase/2-methoxy-6-polyprenyl-1,4-benzoquinol methylase UbiE [Candidatus Methanoperedens sp.]|nr:bifunctional demethylmenaquinone methyltransferase/2-methoxy-6-polyprenyl-1,4-benzoquinol methylase UbiE [Candidatus Methanoperedens sp.]